MRPRYKPPLKRKYFHKKRKINKKDMVAIKKRIEQINQKKFLKELRRKNNL